MMLLTGCATPGSGTQFLDNLAGCERHYNGVVSAGLIGSGFNGSIRVDCAPRGAAPQTGDPEPTWTTPVS